MFPSTCSPGATGKLITSCPVWQPPCKRRLTRRGSHDSSVSPASGRRTRRPAGPTAPAAVPGRPPAPH